MIGLFAVAGIILCWSFYSANRSGRLEEVTFYSEALKAEKSLYVYLPPGYVFHPERSYPVLYLLPGNPGNGRDWIDNGAILQTVDRLNAQHAIAPFILVLPDGHGPKVSFSQYVDSDIIDQQMETYIVKDVVNLIDASYRTIKDSKHRAIGGNSSGGFGALNSAFHYPTIFTTVVSLSGYSVPLAETASQLLTPVGIEKYNLLSQVQAPYAATPHVYLYYGDNDYLDFDTVSQELYQALVDNGVSVELRSDDGKHEWGSWAINIEQALLFVDRQFANDQTAVK